MKMLWITWVTKAMNRVLALDPESQQRLAPLVGKVMRLQFQGIPIVVDMLFTEMGMECLSTQTASVDVMLRGTPLFFLRLSCNPLDRPRMLREIYIEGDQSVAEHVLQLFDGLDIDWEEYLSHWTGDFVAHKLGMMGQELKQFTGSMRASLQRQVDEYLHEEIRLFPTQEELTSFYAAVDEVRMDSDRLAARIHFLEQRRKQPGAR